MPININSNAIVEDPSTIGDGTSIWHFSHIRSGAVIGSNCNIGHCVYIDEGVTIGARAKIQNKVSIFNGVEIADDVFIGPHVCFTNDLNPRATNDNWKIMPTNVKSGVSIGANSTIRCGITIGEYAMVGAGSVVTKDVEPFSLVMGVPAKVVGQVCYCGEKLINDGDDLLDISDIHCNHS
jgi:UDP-2-acetamido-3-amino-2,3-dideoxy-glucuronate N-acetyltransferase